MTTIDRARRGLAAVGRSTVLFALSAMKLGATVLPAVLMLPKWVSAVGLTVLLIVPGARLLAVITRKLLARWDGRPIASPYQPLPTLVRTENGWYWNGYDFQRSRLVARAQRRMRWTFVDPATWRDIAWTVVDPVLALPLALPVALVGGGLYVTALSLAGRPVGLHELPRLPVPVAGVGGLVLIALGVACAPLMSGVYQSVTRNWLAPSSRTLLTRRASHLYATRIELLTTQASELRRIERDLHDGAQARLVAIGIAVSTAELAVPTDPEQALKQLAKARELAGLALTELRDLVHNIHPPVLAERGLGGAIQALAIDAPMAVEVTVDLGGRLEAAVESAVYFAVAELLTNVAKHTHAERASVEISHRAGTLQTVVTDDGDGGVDPANGSGLRGMERRLQTFDGALRVDSPPGGPTRITLTIPCAAPVTAIGHEPGGERATASSASAPRTPATGRTA
ncbi:histidine kinase [Kitasatospora sp. NPDC053057]|uniref:sensor histidine kinase n=1 Tax=Kitasatospora sp. NPDC053057 TaxID=3364062 RepID=UPI0037C79E15